MSRLARNLVAALLLLPGCGDEPPEPERFRVVVPDARSPREPCVERVPERKALFGDLHVHTTLSSDAWNYDLDVRPAGAYAYAFGEPVLLPPRDAQGRGTREARIDRPLDFAAVTDHAEFLGETLLCTSPDSPVYESELCVDIRASTVPADNPLALKIMTPWPSRDEETCGVDGVRCREYSSLAWQEIIDAAEQWNDTSSACSRTTFIGYEWSGYRLGSNLHRNVIFRNEIVPALPISYVDRSREWDLWQLLRDVCLDSGTGCDVLAIPHNSNISNGRMFSVDYAGASGAREQAERAALRQALEPIVEVMQHKGDSECRAEGSGLLGAADELCDFEKFEEVNWVRYDDGDPGECWESFADWVPHLGPDCRSGRSYVRHALIEGLREEDRIGVNPFKLGLSASTDTHNALAGGVGERTWLGHLGIADGDPATQLSEEPGVMGNMGSGPGGLIGVWAEENSREAIFDAMRRREVFGTSGPRIEPRFFGGWDYPEDLCAQSDWLARADAAGVPMGADLEAAQGGDGPVFVVAAAKDPGTAGLPGGDLQRIQIIKGWVDDEGELHQQVVDVAGGDNGAGVDASTCEPEGQGAAQLCGVWRDPAFDPARRAVYYARVLENPSCRYSAWHCLRFPPGEKPSGCEHRVMNRLQHERAWTSPIWYTPPQ